MASYPGSAGGGPRASSPQPALLRHGTPPPFLGGLRGPWGSDRDICGQRPCITEAPGTCPPCLETQLSTGDSVTPPRKEQGAHCHLKQYVIYTNILRKSEHLHAFYMHGEGNGNPLQDSCLENPMDGGAWWATVHGVTKSRT